MNILVTGGAGFIGHLTANALVDKGHYVRILDNLLPQSHDDTYQSLDRLHDSIDFHQGDIRNIYDVSRAIDDIDIVYHFAAETGVEQSMYKMDRYVDVNIRGTAVLCDCITKQSEKISKIILASSRAVYGEGRYKCPQCGDADILVARSKKDLNNNKWDFYCVYCSTMNNNYDSLVPQPTMEWSSLTPSSIYGLTKKVQEDLVKNLSIISDIPSVILRYFNVIGEGQSSRNPYTGIASIFCRQLLENKTVDIYEDGAMLRCFIDVKDVVDINVSVLNNKLVNNQTINVGSGIALSVLELATRLKQLTGSTSTINISGKFRLGDVRHCFSDIGLLKRLLKFKPMYKIDETLMNIVNGIKL